MNFSFSEEEKALHERVKKIVDEKLIPLEKQIGETYEISDDVVRILAEEGLFALMVPEEFGGKGKKGDIQSIPICIVREQLGRGAPMADSLFAMQGLGSYPITLTGTDEQKEKYLRPLVNGEKLASVGITEPEAGSDAAGIQSHAVLDGDHYILNGHKHFISNGGRADTYTVFAKTAPDKGTKGISAFVLEKGMPGFEFGRIYELVAAHLTRELFFKDCRVSRQNLLGNENDGFKIMMKNLDVFRASVGAVALGFAQAAMEAALDYARKRVQFGQPIAQFQGIQFKLADMATELDAARLLVYRAAWLKDQGVPRVSKESSMAKLFATEMAQRVVDQGLQIFGGRGLIKGNPLELLYREVRAIRIYEGTSEVQRWVIGLNMLREQQ